MSQIASVKKIDGSYQLNHLPAIYKTEPMLKSHKGLMEYLGKYEAYKSAMRKLPPIINADSKAYIGIEIEVEKVEGSNWNSAPQGWYISKDPSLRNNGAEFISAPLEPESIRSALTAMYISLRYGQKTPVDFSWRTSIHAHLNVRDFTPEQIGTLILAYLAFEEQFFQFAGEDRARANFAVPIYDTEFDHHLSKFFNGSYSIGEVSHFWHKYSALNLIPVAGGADESGLGKSKKGTIEFRHLGGTKELGKLVNWVNLILCLHNFAGSKLFDEVRKQILSIKTNTAYQTFKEEIFGPLVELFPIPTRFPNKSLSYVKQCFNIAPHFETITKDCGLADMLSKRVLVDETEGPPIKKGAVAKKKPNKLTSGLAGWNLPPNEIWFDPQGIKPTVSTSD